ncbi:unnamed protein product [Triticum turgidum subsp. durum]|uniref:Uncharacterized protein n=2 Tax=Triticum TaxID=4564 RepID=A0A9R1RZL9_TRITD|nr:unnamed protein product [Triticum aestivum]VAH75498.1 unnamed protein product [Triticum turgidum subsp. durum]
MTPPFLAASGPDDYAFVRCASGCDSWAPHHVRLDGDSYRLCSSCVLLSNPEAYCSACLLLLFPGAYAASSREARVDFSPGPTAACSNCGVFVAHLSCIPDPYSFICPPCAAAVDNVPFSYDLAGVGRSARVLLTAALLSHESALHDAAAAREKAERSLQEAAAARRLARDMLDAAFRAAEAEAYRDAKEQATPSAPAVVHLKKKTPNTNGHKRKTPKSNDANREKDKLLKFNDMQQPALAFAAAAAAAASSMPSPSPMQSSRLNQSSADRAAKDDYRALFGTLQ